MEPKILAGVRKCPRMGPINIRATGWAVGESLGAGRGGRPDALILSRSPRSDEAR
jgi:hypothetical protein